MTQDKIDEAHRRIGISVIKTFFIGLVLGGLITWTII